MANGKREKLNLIPDEWVYIQVLQDTPATGEGEYGTWYLYSAKEYDSKLKVWSKEKSFFPTPKLQNLIESIGIEPKTTFAVMEKATKNLKTKKPYTYYDVEYNKEKYSTKETNGEPLESPKIPPPPDESETLIPPEPEQLKPKKFGDIAVPVWETITNWVLPKEVELTEDKLIQFRLKVVEISGMMVCNQCNLHGILSEK